MLEASHVYIIVLLFRYKTSKLTQHVTKQLHIQETMAEGKVFCVWREKLRGSYARVA